MNALEVLGSFLNFAGGAVLSLDAIRIRRRMREEAGASLLLKAIQQQGDKAVLSDEAGRPLSTEAAWQRWFAERSFRLAVLGFGLMTAGFFLEMLAVFRAP